MLVQSCEEVRPTSCCQVARPCSKARVTASPSHSRRGLSSRCRSSSWPTRAKVLGMVWWIDLALLLAHSRRCGSRRENLTTPALSVSAACILESRSCAVIFPGLREPLSKWILPAILLCTSCEFGVPCGCSHGSLQLDRRHAPSGVVWCGHHVHLGNCRPKKMCCSRPRC